MGINKIRNGYCEYIIPIPITKKYVKKQVVSDGVKFKINKTNKIEGVNKFLQRIIARELLMISWNPSYVQ